MSENNTDRSFVRGPSVVAGRYQVDKLIARGGMATVYLAHQLKLNRAVALKVLTPPPDADDAASFEQRFHLEAETLASLSHPNIVTLYDFGETEDGRFYLALEYVDGPRLSDMLRDGPLPVDNALAIVLQVCAGLRYSHKRGVVHRDLKPSNLLVKLSDDGEQLVKLVDFGLVKLTSDDQSITRAGLILGSPHCMAPEQVKGLDVDHRADIYAIGVLLFRTITGHYPFHGPNSAATMIAHLNQAVPTFFSVAPQLIVPEGLEEIVRRCLEKAPQDRFQNVKELMEALAACMNLAPDQFRSVSQASSMLQRSSMVGLGQPQRSRLPLAAIAFAVGSAMVLVTLVLGAVVGGILVQRDGMGLLGAPPVTAPPTPSLSAIDKPDPAPVDEATPEDEADEGSAAAAAVEAEEPQRTPEATPKPVQPRRSQPRTRTAPKTPKPATPVPAGGSTEASTEQTKSKAESEEDDKAPEGYMGMPDDLFK